MYITLLGRHTTARSTFAQTVLGKTTLLIVLVDKTNVTAINATEKCPTAVAMLVSLTDVGLVVRQT